MPAPAPAPEVAAASAPEAPPPQAAPAPAPAEASAPDVAPALPASDEPGFLANLLDHPFLLPGAGLLVALLAGFGFYRLRTQGRRDSGETSFLESRLQPDSFFGASGGQRVDTRDASGVPSSMSYSLSQLDAIGDVDPVAEADVYLAYGRDLQAEEILKEAMRANPDRLAIRTKLLEVYAKRRDTKGYELLATQLYAMTGGQGEEWVKMQALGLSIDPENPMYQPGGRPEGMSGQTIDMVEPLGASTLPASVLPSPSTFEAQRSGFQQDPGVDLDLDITTPNVTELRPAPPIERTQPIAPPSAKDDDASADLALDLDLPNLSLDEPSYAASPAPAPTQPADLDLPDLGGLDMSEPVSDDAMARKLELADEFRQIGDVEGARDLLQEVVAKSSGTLRAKAQGMLDELG